MRGVWPMLSAVFTINALGLGYSPASYVALAVIGLLSSIGTAGVPGTAIVTATTVFTAVGLPVQLLVPLVPVSNIVGMPSTMANVSAAVTCAAIVSRQTGEFDEGVLDSARAGGIAIARAWSCRRLAGRLRLLSFLLRLPSARWVLRRPSSPRPSRLESVRPISRCSRDSR